MIKSPRGTGSPLVAQVHEAQAACSAVDGRLLLHVVPMKGPDSLRVLQKFVAKFAVETKQAFAQDQSHMGHCHELEAARTGLTKIAGWDEDGGSLCWSIPRLLDEKDAAS